MPYVENAAAAWYTSGNADQTARDTVIRARLQEIHAALLDVGLVEVPDTGAMADPSTLSAPLPNSVVTSNTAFYSGYKIYTFEDSSAVNPVYLKVGYGATSISATAASALVRINLGQGTDGALNLTGYLFEGRTYYIGGSNTAANYDAAKLRVVGSMDLGILGIALGESGLQNPQLFCLERLRDEDGEPLPEEGIYVHSYNSGVAAGTTEFANSIFEIDSNGVGTLIRDGYSTSVTGAATPAILSLGTLPGGSVNDNTPVYPHFPFSYRPHPPALCFMGIEQSAIAADVVIPVSRYGVSRSYKNIAATSTAAGGSGDLLMLITPE